MQGSFLGGLLTFTLFVSTTILSSRRHNVIAVSPSSHRLRSLLTSTTLRFDFDSGTRDHKLDCSVLTPLPFA